MQYTSAFAVVGLLTKNMVKLFNRTINSHMGNFTSTPDALLTEYSQARTQKQIEKAEKNLKEYVEENPSSVQGHTYEYKELDDILSISLKDKQYHEVNIDGKQVGYHKTYNEKNTIILQCTASQEIKGRNAIEKIKLNPELLNELLTKNETLEQLLRAEKNTQILIPYNISGYHWYVIEILVDHNKKEITAYAHDNLGNRTCDKIAQTACRTFFNDLFKKPQYKYSFPSSPYINIRSANNNCGAATILDILALADDKKTLPNDFAQTKTATPKQIGFLTKLSKKHLQEREKDLNVYNQLARQILEIPGNTQKPHLKQLKSDYEKSTETETAIKPLKEYIETNIIELNQLPFGAVQIDNIFSQEVESDKDVIFYTEEDHLYSETSMRRAYIKEQKKSVNILLPCMGAENLICEGATRPQSKLSQILLNQYLCKTELNILSETYKKKTVNVIFPYFENNTWSVIQISINQRKNTASVSVHTDHNTQPEKYKEPIQSFISKHFQSYNTTFNTNHRNIKCDASDVESIRATTALFDSQETPICLKSLNDITEGRLQNHKLLNNRLILEATKGANPHYQALTRQNTLALPYKPTPKTSLFTARTSVKIRHTPTKQPEQQGMHPCIFFLRVVLCAIALTALIIGIGTCVMSPNQESRQSVISICIGTFMLACAGLILTCFPTTNVNQAHAEEKRNTINL